MTEQKRLQRQGLSIFDSPAAGGPTSDKVPAPAGARPAGPAQGGTPLPPVAASEPEPASRPVATAPSFPAVRRGGYDKAAVDAYVARVESTGSSATSAATKDAAALRARVAELEERLSETDNPTYAGLGGRAAAVLRLAQEEADALRSRAQQAADESRRRVLTEAAALRADAEKEAADIRTVQMQEIEERRATVLAEAEQHRNLARAESQDILASSKREAEQLRLAAQQEVNSLRTSAKRESEQLRATADRETSEARRALAVEKERLTKEAADHHTNAVAETTRLIQEAEARAGAAESRTREAIAAATKHREQATAESERTLVRSRREAEQIVTAARRQAEQIVRNAQADAERQQTAVKRDLEMLQTRRDGIVAQLGQLQDVLKSFSDPAPAPTGRPVARGAESDDLPEAQDRAS